MEMETETEKRKRSDDREADGRRTRAKGEERDPRVEQTATETATEEEVEEFFAILRRVHEVMRYFGKEKEGATKKKKGEIWKPSFQWEDFEEVSIHNINKGSREKIRDAEAVEENQVVPLALDLNSAPEPEPETAAERI